MKEEDIHLNLLSRYVANEITSEEVDELLEWIGEDPEREKMLREFQETWDAAKKYPENFKVDTSSAWMKLRQSINDEEEDVQPVDSSSIKKWIALFAIMGTILTGAFLAIKYWFY